MGERMTRTVRRLLEWLLSSGPLLESQITGSGLSAALNEALRAGWADMIAHAHVVERGGAPAAAVVITEAGRNALDKKAAR